MHATPPPPYDLARRLIEHEAAMVPTPTGTDDAALRVFDKLRGVLAKLVGLAGYRSILDRARALAEEETPWLATVVEIKDDGALARFGDGEPNPDAVARGARFILVQLLALLELFIGSTLTLRVVRDVWPDAPLDDRQPTEKEIPR